MGPFLTQFGQFLEKNFFQNRENREIYNILKTFISHVCLLLGSWDHAQSIANLMQYPKMALLEGIFKPGVEISYLENVQNFVIFSIFQIDCKFGLTVLLLQCFPMSNYNFLLVAWSQGQHRNQWFIVWYVQHSPRGQSFWKQKFQSRIMVKNDKVSENFIFSLNYVESSEFKNLAL